MPERTLIQFMDHFYRRGSEVAYAQARGYRMAHWTYRKVAETACRFARELEARGIGPGDRVMIWGKNGPEWAAAFFGSLLRGAVVVPMDRIATTDFAERVAHQVDAKGLVRSQDQMPLEIAGLDLILETLPESLMIHDGSPYAAPSMRREDPVEIVFTSGTTADPKGVLITHGNILANLEPLETEIAKYRKYERFVHPLRFLNLLPLSHVFGQFLGLFVPPLLGGTVIFQESLNPSEIINTVRRERVSVLVTVPRLLQSLRDKIERDYEAAGRRDWFNQQLEAAEDEHFIKRWWRFRRIHNQFGWKFWAMVSGGATLDADTEAFWERLSFVVVQGYGLTETTSVISVNHPFKREKGSIGQVLPGLEIRLNESGEILVRGENIASSYWQGQERKPVLGQEGWFHTGDMGELDKEGNLYFKGRMKNVLVTPAGMNIYPEDLEATLRRQPEVRDCVVIGLARGGNEEPCAVLTLRQNIKDPELIIQRANQSLADYQQIRHWFVWPSEDFPRTSTQKPRTNLIQEMVQSQLEGNRQTPAPAGTLADLIAQIAGRHDLPIAKDAHLSTDLNLSSIDRVELLGAIEDRYQVDLNEMNFSKATTVGELERMLRQPVSPQVEHHYPRWAQRWPVTWIRPAIYYLLTWPATLLLGYPKVSGRRHLRGVTGPVLVVSNHITSIDVGFILAALPLRLRHRLAVAMEGERLQAMRHPPGEMGLLRRCLQKIGYGLAVALFNVFPLPQQSGFRRSFAYAGESVDRGYSVLVFPEGRRTPDGRLAPFRAGIGLLANNLGLPIIPVRIDGLYELKLAGKWAALPGAVKVTLGSPLRFDPRTDPASIAQALEKSVASLRQD